MEEPAERSVPEKRIAGKLGVISSALLSRLAIDQAAKDAQAGELFVKDGFNLNEIRQISIEFLNILKIDNLWIMARSLTRLKLSNNVIERMENLDCLVNLIELDLSFNRIRVIENIQSLARLRSLLLYSNEIREVAGFDGSTELAVLSLGANKIATWDHVAYLRRFQKLRSLNIAGNECTRKDGYFDYVVGFLPRLVYFNYRMIGDSERRVAQQNHLREISSLEEKEATEREEARERESERERQDLLSLSYVEYLDADQLFQQMYLNDREGKELSTLNEDTLAAYEEYREKFTGLCHELYELGLRQHERRSREIKLFEKIVDEGRDAVNARARAMMDEIIERKVDIFEKLGKLLSDESGQDAVAIDDPEVDDDIREKVEKARYISDSFNDLLSKSWERLMYGETTLHEQIEVNDKIHRYPPDHDEIVSATEDVSVEQDSNETHKSSMEDMTSNLKDAAHAIFALMRDAESDYNYIIENLAIVYANGFSDASKMPSHHLEICGDKNIVGNNLAASRDLHLQTIDTREDAMMSRIKSWLDDYTERLTREESERNRRQVLEISHFLREQRREFDGIQSQSQLAKGDPMNAWIFS